MPRASATTPASALAAADQARDETAEQLAEAESTIEALEGDRTDLQRRLAAAALQVQTAASSLDERDRQLAALGRELTTAQTAASDARNQIAQLAIERRDLRCRARHSQSEPALASPSRPISCLLRPAASTALGRRVTEQREELDNLLVDLGRALSWIGRCPCRSSSRASTSQAAGRCRSTACPSSSSPMLIRTISSSPFASCAIQPARPRNRSRSESVISPW